MKKTLIKKISNQVPQELQHFIADADIYDSSSSLKLAYILLIKMAVII